MVVFCILSHFEVFKCMLFCICFVIYEKKLFDIKIMELTMKGFLNLILLIFFFLVQKMSSANCVCCIYSDALETTFIMETSNMNPDQAAPLGAV